MASFITCMWVVTVTSVKSACAVNFPTPVLFQTVVAGGEAAAGESLYILRNSTFEDQSLFIKVSP